MQAIGGVRFLGNGDVDSGLSYRAEALGDAAVAPPLKRFRVLGRRHKDTYETVSSLHALVFDGSRNMPAEPSLGTGPLSTCLRHHAAALQCDHHDILFLSRRCSLRWRGSDNGCNRKVQRTNYFLLSFVQPFGPLGQHGCLFALRSRQLQGNVAGQPNQIYRSGLLDFTSRVSVNLRGGPAMPAQEFRKWRQKTLLGVSLKVLAPTGQYDPTKLVNWGANRWAFKPDVGYSKRWNNWFLDSYAGAWFYTTNPQYYSPPVPKPQTEKPIGAFEGHLSYNLKPRLWCSLDGNFWFGGVTSLSGIANPATRQTSSRVGVTASLPLGPHQSVKVSYNNGDYIRFGGNYQSVAVAWQYSWIGRPN